ncbi:tyrosine-type recombinase/integrase [Nocardia asteroides]
MSALAAVSAQADSVPEVEDSLRWREWLEARLAPEWRPKEWDGVALLFTGDYDNPTTVVSKCRTAACTASVLAFTGRLCRRCGKALRASGMDVEAFVGTHVPTAVNRGFVTETCRVERSGEVCPRLATTHGLCRSHFSQYYAYAGRHHATTIEQWLRARPKPLPRLPLCRVPGCDHQQFAATLELCVYHHRGWQAHRRAEKLPVVADIERIAWTQRQTPYLTGAQFSLRHLGPTLRAEVLYLLQHRDQHQHRVNPGSTRWIVAELADHVDVRTGSWLSVDLEALVARWTSADVKSHVRYWDRVIRLSYDEYCGRDSLANHRLDLVAAGVRSRQTRTGVRSQNRCVDVDQIRQSWFRQVFIEWVRQTTPDGHIFRPAFQACLLASQALAMRSGEGEDPTQLQLADMDASVDAIRAARRLDGQPYSAKHRQTLVAKLFTVFDFGRAVGLMDSVAGGFARQRHHRIPDDPVQDDVGKAIPETVIRQLDSQLHLLGRDFPYGDLNRADVQALFATAYVILRDTGRRPQEICSLSADCLEQDGEDFILLWSNHKSRRFRRRLPIIAQTAEAIKAWQGRRRHIPAPAESSAYLFPAITSAAGSPYMTTASLSQAIRLWVHSMATLDSDAVDDNGLPVPVDPSLIYPYAFRHSYAQRHADAGVPVDVLRDLMDHRSVDTTMGYYKISLKRKREAIKTMRLAVTDRTGAPAPMSSNVAYEARSVAVPFGNCIEPSNIKAGGKACRIRFQCAGCGFYRPDPSYLPAVEDHIRSLKADREAARAMDADEFVIRNLTDQIEAFHGITSIIKDHLASLPADERGRIEDASRVLRKARAAEGHKLLPLLVAERESARS